MAIFGHPRWPSAAILDFFFKFKSCIITSADPENPTLEPNFMFLCCIQPELCWFKYMKNNGGRPPSSSVPLKLRHYDAIQIYILYTSCNYPSSRRSKDGVVSALRASILSALAGLSAIFIVHARILSALMGLCKEFN